MFVKCFTQMLFYTYFTVIFYIFVSINKNTGLSTNFVFTLSCSVQQ